MSVVRGYVSFDARGVFTVLRKLDGYFFSRLSMRAFRE